MKLNKTMGRVATTLVATAMLASVAVVPAFATDPGDPVTSDKVEGGIAQGDDLSTITLNKKLVLPDEVATPTGSFSFAVTPVQNVAGTIESNGVDYTIFAAPESATGSGSASVSPTSPRSEDDYVTSGEVTLTGTDVVTVDLTVTLPEANDIAAQHGAGVYKYTIDEQNFAADSDYYEATQGLDMYLVVERANSGVITTSETYEISSVIVYPAGTTPDGTNDASKTADYVNYYKLGADGSKEVNDMAFTKNIAGVMGNMSDTFTFTVGVPGVDDGVVFKYTDSRASSETKTVTADDGLLTFTGIGSGTTITVKGLDIGEQYTITETDPGTYSVSTSTDNESNKNDATATLTIQQDSTVSTTFTNTRNAVSPTGIVMNVAPYALLVVVAAAGCFVFMRKRRED